jgi:hypothetical protein
MLGSLFGYFFCMITVFTAVAVLLTGFVNIPTLGNGRHHLRPPAIGQTVTDMVETQRHSQVAKKTSAANDVTPVVATANADTKKIKAKPKVLARQPDNYGYRDARGYAQRGLFFR